MRLKPGVRISGLRPEMVLGLMIANDVFKAHDSEMIITGALDGKHGRGSLHFVGCAIDLRTRNLHENNVPTIVADMKLNLGKDFDVILESNHIHFEFQPKTGINI